MKGGPSSGWHPGAVVVVCSECRRRVPQYGGHDDVPESPMGHFVAHPLQSEQLEAERQAHSEARRLLMAALERIPPQLEAPSEPRESPQTVEEEPERAHTAPADYGRVSGAVQRPWWRRVFGR